MQFFMHDLYVVSKSAYHLLEKNRLLWVEFKWCCSFRWKIFQEKGNGKEFPKISVPFVHILDARLLMVTFPQEVMQLQKFGCHVCCYPGPTAVQKNLLKIPFKW